MRDSSRRVTEKTIQREGVSLEGIGIGGEVGAADCFLRQRRQLKVGGKSRWVFGIGFDDHIGIPRNSPPPPLLGDRGAGGPPWLLARPEVRRGRAGDGARCESKKFN